MNINKRAMKYAKENNYYRPSKIKKLLRLFDKRMKILKDELGHSICPECGSIDTEVDYDDSEYSAEAYMFCNDCWKIYRDKKYIDVYNEIDLYSYFDSIRLEVWAFNEPGDGYEWIEKCDSYMDNMIETLIQELKS